MHASRHAWLHSAAARLKCHYTVSIAQQDLPSIECSGHQIINHCCAGSIVLCSSE